MIRDQALAVSGLLVEQLGGPSVKPYQPAGLWKELAGDRGLRAGPRRRTSIAAACTPSGSARSPPPTMMTFDAAGRETCTVRETRTNTPLQALTLLNDVTYRRGRPRAGRAHDARGRRDAARSASRSAFRLATARAPDAAGAATSCSAASSDHLAHYRARPRGGRRSSLSVGESPRDETLDPAELAAYTAVASADPEPGRDDHQGVSRWTRSSSIGSRITRRHFFGRRRARRGRAGDRCSARDWLAAAGAPARDRRPARPAALRRRRRSGSSTCSSPARPSQIDLFDYKPKLDELRGTELPDSIRKGQRLTGMTVDAGPASRSRPSQFQFAQHGQSGAWVSELLPHTAQRRRRAVLHQVDAHRGDQPRPGDHVLPDRRAARRPAEHRRVARPTAWAARTRTCPRSS